MEIMTDPASPYYDPLAKELLEVKATDPYRFTVTLTRGYLDPLSLMTFDLLPAHLLPGGRSPRNLSFGKQPVGTGPYVYQGVDGREMVFVANPNYHRPHAPDGPNVKEIRLVEYTDFATAREGLANGTYHALLDLTTKEMEQLSGMQQATVVTPTEPRVAVEPYLANPSVYFLLPNCRKPPFSSKNMRLAVGLSIDRERILREVFRGTGAKKYHTPLNGPFPLGSWAYNPALNPAKVSPFNPNLARDKLQQGRAEAGNVSAFTIKHAAEDLTAGPACKEIKADLDKLGMAIKVEAVPFQKLMGEMVADRPNFDLIYWRYDFDNETLSLWPLLDPKGDGPNGRNYLGLSQVSEIENKFREIQNRRDFAYVRQQSHILHDALTQTHMVPIPLWQLDKHVAIHKSVIVTRVHPIHFVDDVEEWRLAGR
jgi:peptide/nickel transport system substrate-binding protein